MITPVYIQSLILWVYTTRAGLYSQFLCWGDHGEFCAIKFEHL